VWAGRFTIYKSSGKEGYRKEINCMKATLGPSQKKNVNKTNKMKVGTFKAQKTIAAAFNVACNIQK